MNELTQTVLFYVDQHIREEGFSPSLSEIAAHTYVQPATVMRHLDKLEAKGWISRIPGKARSIHLLKPVVKAQPEGE